MVEMSVIILFALLGGAQLMENRYRGKREYPRRNPQKLTKMGDQWYNN